MSAAKNDLKKGKRICGDETRRTPPWVFIVHLRRGCPLGLETIIIRWKMNAS